MQSSSPKLLPSEESNCSSSNSNRNSKMTGASPAPSAPSAAAATAPINIYKLEIHGKKADSVNNIFPIQTNSRGDFKKPSFKNLSTLADQKAFVEWMKEQKFVPHHNYSINQQENGNLLNRSQSRTAEGGGGGGNNSSGRYTRPNSHNYSSATTSRNKKTFEEKMQSIRCNMTNMQQQSQTRKMLFSSNFTKQESNAPQYNSVQQPAGMRTRCPQPILRTPVSVMSASCQNEIEEIRSPEFMSSSIEEVPCDVQKKVKKTSFRPKTAPVLLYQESLESGKSSPGQRVYTSSGVYTAADYCTTPIYPPSSSSRSMSRPQTAKMLNASAGGSERSSPFDMKLRDIQPGPVPLNDAWTEVTLDNQHRSGQVSDELKDDYDKALREFGWKMEVPGDPLKIKREFLNQRKSLTVTVPEPEILQQPPKMMKENKDTFFYNTIPRKVTTFEINPDFLSQRYNARREALRKKGNWNYNFRNFSFVY